MRILLTGACGFLGSHLTRRLLAEGHDVIGVDNELTGHRTNLLDLATHPRLVLMRHDVIEPVNLPGRVDWVMHFASAASPPKYLAHPIDTLRVNAEGTRHLLELCQRQGAAFFLASTSEVYGDPEVHPQPESYWGNVNPNGPRSVYDEAKRYAEAMTLACHRSWGVPVRIIRIFNTYGPNMDPEDGRVVTNFIMQGLQGQPLTVYGGGAQTRSFQYVDDLVEGIVRLMGVEYFGPVNLGNPEEYRVLELAHMIRELCGSRSVVEYRPMPQDDPRQRRPDITLARRLLDWEPRVPVREGLERTIAHFRDVLRAREALAS